ncbi:MAG: VOC family protein [Bdellovibrionota bacterium]
MKELIPYLSFNGNCREAMSFYQGIFGGKLEIMPWDDVPEDSCGDNINKSAMKGKAMHCSLTNGSFNLMGADIPQGEPKKGDNIHLCINCESVDEIDKLFNSLSVGGDAIMPLGDTFWGARFGIVIDKFGIYWMLNYPLKS